MDSLAMSAGEVFPTRQHFQLRVAEVCNFLYKVLRWSPLEDDPSDSNAGIYSGYACARSWASRDTFFVKAVRKLRTEGWQVQNLDLSQTSHRQSTEGNVQRKCPFTAKQLAPIIIPFIRNNSEISAKEIRDHLQDYVRHEFVSDAMIQNVRDTARAVIFGKPETNITFIEEYVKLLVEAGHKARVKIVDRTGAKRIIVKNAHEEHRRKMRNSSASSRTEFNAREYQRLNGIKIRQALGTYEEARFVTGVFFAPGPSVQAGNQSLSLYSADAAYLNWGACTLYSMYSRSSNMGAFCLGHAIIGGNEDKQGWTDFFRFSREHYPWLNSSTKTIISDRDKGLLNALSSVFPNACGFYCARHRAENITKQFGKEAEDAFNAAVSSMTLQQLQDVKQNQIGKLSVRAKAYIYLVQDEMQYPIARVILGSSKMFGKSTNGMSEAMNSANRPARIRGLDMFNAFAKLIEMEKKRFNANKNDAERRAYPLTEYARKKYEETLRRAENCRVESSDAYAAVVMSLSSRKTFRVELTGNQSGAGTLFGSCSCGRSEMVYFPCEHMASFAVMEGFADFEIVPIEYHTRRYRDQYPSSILFVSVSSDDAKSRSPNLALRVSPHLPRKRGRPQTRRARSFMERRFKRPRLCSKCCLPRHTAPKCTANLDDDERE